MPIRFMCIDCGKKMRAPEHLAGRRAKCPGCGADVVIPLAGGDEVSAPFPQAGRGEAGAASGGPPSLDPPCPQCGSPLAAGAVRCRSCSWVDPSVAPPMRGPVAVAIVGPQRGFFRDALLSFVFHFKGSGPFVLVMLIILLTALPFTVLLGGSGFIGSILIRGLVCSLLLNVILETCAGEDILPGFDATDGIWDGIYKPLIRFCGGTLYTFWPAIAWFICMWQYMISEPLAGVAGAHWFSPAPGGPSAAAIAVQYVLFGLGVFLWPMTMLTIGVHGMQLGPLRYDRQVVTILRALGPYLAVCLLLAGVVVMWGLVEGFVRGLVRSDGSDLGAMIGGAIAGVAVGAACQAYFSTAAMRIIGLFYRHYKHRFAWQAE